MRDLHRAALLDDTVRRGAVRAHADLLACAQDCLDRGLALQIVELGTAEAAEVCGALWGGKKDTGAFLPISAIADASRDTLLTLQMHDSMLMVGRKYPM
jgi:hypothetical protein